jgi:hypothetical protein
LRASDKAIAIACLRLVTFLPLRPLFSLPLFISRISRSTFFPTDGLYFLELDFLLDLRVALFAAVFFADFLPVFVVFFAEVFLLALFLLGDFFEDFLLAFLVAILSSQFISEGTRRSTSCMQPEESLIQ